MATVNFSVPEDIKQAFNKAFANENKSAVLSALMRRAVEEREMEQRRVLIIRQLTEKCAQRPWATDEQIQSAREEGRS